MSELEQKAFQKRQVAHKISVSDILNAVFAKDELSAGYIRLRDVNISRVNVIATVVDKSERDSNFSSAMIDDGTGKILLRSFENTGLFSKADVGDFVLVIGRIREFSGERYVMPEIFKKIDDLGWVSARKMELEKAGAADNNPKIPEQKKNGLAEESNLSVYDEVFSLIRKLDNGDGVSVEEVVSNSKSGEAEGIVNRLLENGDIFEIKPGKLKVLE